MTDITVKYDYLAIMVNNSQISLYPVKFTDLSIGNDQSGMSIYPNGIKGKGFMISDNNCYNKMFDAFKKIQVPSTIGTMFQTGLNKVLGSLVIEQMNA